MPRKPNITREEFRQALRNADEARKTLAGLFPPVSNVKMVNFADETDPQIMGKYYPDNDDILISILGGGAQAPYPLTVPEISESGMHESLHGLFRKGLGVPRDQDHSYIPEVLAPLSEALNDVAFGRKVSPEGREERQSKALGELFFPPDRLDVGMAPNRRNLDAQGRVRKISNKAKELAKDVK